MLAARMQRFKEAKERALTPRCVPDVVCVFLSHAALSGEHQRLREAPDVLHTFLEEDTVFMRLFLSLLCLSVSDPSCACACSLPHAPPTLVAFLLVLALAFLSLLRASSVTISNHISHLRSEDRQSRAPPLPPRVIGNSSRVRLYLCVCVCARVHVCTCVREEETRAFLYKAAFHLRVQICMLDRTRRHATCA